MNFQSTNQKSIIHWKVKLWLFGQNQVSKITIHQGKSKYETSSSRNQKFKISFWKVKVFKLRNFSMCWKLHIFHNFKPIFHHDARWFKRNFQHESCRSQWDIKHCFTQHLLEILGFHVINPWNHVHKTKTLSENFALV